LIFGSLFAFSFYETSIGVNVFFFTLVMVTLLQLVMKNLQLPIKRGTKVYYAGVLLLGASSIFTSSETLQFLNLVGILFLLDLSLLHQVHEVSRWEFSKHVARMFALFFEAIAAIGKPFSDGTNFLKQTKLFKKDKTRNILIGIVIALPLLWVIILLLSSADILFSEMTHNINDFLFSSEVIKVAIIIFFGFLACYCIIAAVVTRTVETVEKTRKKADAAIANTFMTLLCLVYVLFCGIQLVFLFSSGISVLPEQFTFAEYARRGFFELLVVTVINIVLMLICNECFTESKLLRFIITGMTVCTYIMIASSAYRMILYIQAYHLTFLRVFVLLALLVDALVLTGVILKQYKPMFPLFQYCVAVTAICYIVFSFSRPDYFIASYYVNHDETIDSEDIEFLTYELSPDAAGVVIPLIAGTQTNLTEIPLSDVYSDSIIGYYQRITSRQEASSFRDFNLSIYTAYQLTQKYQIN
ncbi:MAG: DUF4173 domain-containing protein, partial [Mobilitalea sp.]